MPRINVPDWALPKPMEKQYEQTPLGELETTPPFLERAKHFLVNDVLRNPNTWWPGPIAFSSTKEAIDDLFSILQRAEFTDEAKTGVRRLAEALEAGQASPQAIEGVKKFMVHNHPHSSVWVYRSPVDPGYNTLAHHQGFRRFQDFNKLGQFRQPITGEPNYGTYMGPSRIGISPNAKRHAEQAALHEWGHAEAAYNPANEASKLVESLYGSVNPDILKSILETHSSKSLGLPRIKADAQEDVFNALLNMSKGSSAERFYQMNKTHYHEPTEQIAELWGLQKGGGRYFRPSPNIPDETFFFNLMNSPTARQSDREAARFILDTIVSGKEGRPALPSGIEEIDRFIRGGR